MGANDRIKKTPGFGDRLMKLAGEFEKAGWPIFFPGIVLLLFGIFSLLFRAVSWIRH